MDTIKCVRIWGFYSLQKRKRIEINLLMTIHYWVRLLCWPRSRGSNDSHACRSSNKCDSELKLNYILGRLILHLFYMISFPFSFFFIHLSSSSQIISVQSYVIAFEVWDESGNCRFALNCGLSLGHCANFKLCVDIFLVQTVKVFSIEPYARTGTLSSWKDVECERWSSMTIVQIDNGERLPPIVDGVI